MTHALDDSAQHLLRDLAPQVLGILVRRYRDFAGCEDAVQEALIAAAQQWPSGGAPDNARGWLLKVATRRLADQVRSETARRLREQLVVSLVPMDEQIALAADVAGGERDDTLDLYFMCCHPSLTPSSQIALTLRAIGGLTTAEIARAFHVPEKTMAQRLSRAKLTIKSAGPLFPELKPAERASRLPAVLHVLYLIFNEGYAASSGEALLRLDLSTEAIRVVRLLERLLPEEAEVGGLLALMLLTDARREARASPDGALIPLDEQDRSRWNQAVVAEGITYLDHALSRASPGPYQIQASIAALHDRAMSAETTDWPQILMLYRLLLAWSDTPMVRLSHAIAVAMVEGPTAGLAALDALGDDSRLTEQHRLDAARGHLLERAGRRDDAAESYQRAANRTGSLAERNYLLCRAARMVDADRG